MIYGEHLDDSMVELDGFGGNKWVRDKCSLLIVLACWPCHQTIGNTGLRKQKGKTNQILANTTQTLNVYTTTLCVCVRFPWCVVTCVSVCFCLCVCVCLNERQQWFAVIHLSLWHRHVFTRKTEAVKLLLLFWNWRDFTACLFVLGLNCVH